MDGKGHPVSLNYSTSDNLETSFSEEGINTETTEDLYQVPFEVVEHFRRHTRSYAKNLRGLQIIHQFTRRGASKIIPTCTKDSFLLGNLEELLNLSLQEIDQPLNQVGPKSPYCSPLWYPFQSPFQSPPQSPPQIMTGNVPPNPNVNNPPS